MAKLTVFVTRLQQLHITAQSPVPPHLVERCLTQTGHPNRDLSKQDRIDSQTDDDHDPRFYITQSLSHSCGSIHLRQTFIISTLLGPHLPILNYALLSQCYPPFPPRRHPSYLGLGAPNLDERWPDMVC